MGTYTTYAALIVDNNDIGYTTSPTIVPTSLGNAEYEVMLATSNYTDTANVNIGDMLIDPNAVRYQILAWQNTTFSSGNPPTKSSDNGIPLDDAYFGDNAYVKIKCLDGDILPTTHQGTWSYDAVIQYVTPEEDVSNIGKYQTDTYWVCNIIEVTDIVSGPNHFQIRVETIQSGVDLNNGIVKAGYYLLDSTGYIYKIQAYTFISTGVYSLVVNDINELDRAPIQSSGALIYNPQYYSTGLPQGPLSYLYNGMSKDVIDGQTMGIIWSHRGLKVNETENVTKIYFQDGFEATTRSSDTTYNIIGGNKALRQLRILEDLSNEIDLDSKIRISLSVDNNGIYSVDSCIYNAPIDIPCSIISPEAITVPENNVMFWLDSPQTLNTVPSVYNTWIYQPAFVTDHHEFYLYFENAASASELVINSIITDANSKQYLVIGFYNPSNTTQNESNSSFQDGWFVKVSYITENTMPTEDTVTYASNMATPTNVIGYYFNAYFQTTSKATEVAVGQTIYDSSLNDYTITGYYNPANSAENETNSFCAEGWIIKVTAITNNVLPIADTVSYNSKIKINDSYTENYKFAFDIENSALIETVVVGLVITDTANNRYTIVDFYNPLDVEQNSSNSLLQAGWLLEVSYLDNDVVPAPNSSYAATINRSDATTGSVITLKDDIPSSNLAGTISLIDTGWQGGKSLFVSSSATSSGNYIFYDDLSAQIDGVSNIFVVTQGNYVAGTLIVNIGGVINDKGIHYFEEDPATGRVRFIVPPTENDKPIIAQYQYV